MNIINPPDFNPKKHIPKLQTLNTRQKELVCFLLEGRSRQDIAAFYHISLKGIEYHIYRLFKALGVANIKQLIVVATKGEHIVRPPASVRSPILLPSAPKRLLLPLVCPSGAFEQTARDNGTPSTDFCKTRVANSNQNGQPLAGKLP